MHGKGCTPSTLVAKSRDLAAGSVEDPECGIKDMIQSFKKVRGEGRHITYLG